MNCKFVIVSLIAVLSVSAAGTTQKSALSPSIPHSQSHVGATPSSSQPPYQRHETWYEFMLKQFNPDNINYGAWIEEKRRAFIENHTRNSYFLYSLCTTLALLVMTALCVKWRADHRRAMWITAEMMADLYNQDSYSRQIAHETIDRYNKHIERCNRAIESGENGLSAAPDNDVEQLRTELMRVAEERDAAIRDRDIAREDLRRKAAILADMSVRLGGSKSGANSVAKANSDVGSANANLVTHINNLQEQLYAERNRNRRLRGG